MTKPCCFCGGFIDEDDVFYICQMQMMSERLHDGNRLDFRTHQRYICLGCKIQRDATFQALLFGSGGVICD